MHPKLTIFAYFPKERMIFSRLQRWAFLDRTTNQMIPKTMSLILKDNYKESYFFTFFIFFLVLEKKASENKFAQTAEKTAQRKIAQKQGRK